MGKPINDPTTPLTSLLDEDWTFIVQKGDQETGPTQRLKLTELLDFIFGNVRTLRTLDERSVAIWNVANTEVQGGLASVEAVEASTAGDFAASEGVVVLGANIDEDGNIVGLRPVVLTGDMVELASPTIMLPNLIGAVPGGSLHLDSQDGDTIVVHPPVAPGAEQEITSTDDYNLSTLEDAVPGQWITVTGNMLASFAMNPSEGYFEFAAHIRNTSINANGFGDVQFGIGIDGADPIAAEDTTPYAISNLYDAVIGGIIPQTSAIASGVTNVTLEARATNNHANTDIELLGSVSSTFLKMVKV